MSRPVFPLFLAVVASAVLGFGAEGQKESAEFIHQAKNPNPTASYKWIQTTLEASGREVDRNKPRPTVLARAMAIVQTCAYDAWAAYDAKAVGTRLGGKLRRPPTERTQANKETAIGYATCRALLDVYAEDRPWIEKVMRDNDLDPDNHSTDLSTPAGVGNVAAAAVIAYRHHDGANQLGDEPGCNGKPYSDYTFYHPINKPNMVTDPTCWMPITFSDGKGGKVTPGFLTPHWYRVKPFSMERSDQFRPGLPPQWGSEQLKKEVDECIEVNANLSLEQKAIVEFMRDGPRSTGQSGHWLQFAQDLSRRDNYTLDQDVKLSFCVANIVHDTFVSCWETKRFYDTSRPYWWVRLQYKGKQVPGCAGPGKGFVSKLPAELWTPYSPEVFITPPFPGYTSGHATASGGAARILEHFSGSNRYGAVEIRNAGELTESKYSTAEMQAKDGRPQSSVPSSREVRIKMPTWSGTAEMAAMSRLWGGYHIRTDNEVGLIAGRKIADHAWPKFRAYFDGTAPEPK